MNTLKTIAFGLLLVSAVIALAQRSKQVRGIPPEILVKFERANEAIDRGQEFLKNDQLDQAIAAFREAVAIYDTIPGFTSSGNYELAKALTSAGRTEEALATYKKAVQWYPSWKDLHVNGPYRAEVLMDYAILLARSGKEEDAKTVYYSGLRMLNPGKSSRQEPFPFLVVFDPDPTMTVWEYSPARLIAAAKMAKAAYMEPKEIEAFLDEVILSEPTWLLPVVYRASRRMGEWRQGFLDQAMRMAANDDEREWVRIMHADGEPQEIGNRIRKESTVLNTAKLELERNHHRLAVCECEGGHGN